MPAARTSAISSSSFAQTPSTDGQANPVRLARRFRELAGFQEDEMDTLAEIAREAREEMDARIEANRAAVSG